MHFLPVSMLAAVLSAGTVPLSTGVAAEPACAPPPALTVPAAEPLPAALSGLPDAEASAALVQLRGTTSWSGSSGQASVRSPQPPAPGSRFRIGSMTKTFTATVVLQLAAEGRLRLDGTVQEYVPGFLPPSYPPITVRQLLTFTSGLNGVEVPHKTPDWFFEHRYDHWAPGSQLDLGKPLLFAPGSAQHYGNADYIMAGLVVEKVTGHRWADEVTRRIVRPLRLSGTTVPGDRIGIPGPHAHGYEATAAGWRDVTLADPSLQWSAASIISTAGDLDRFVVALFSGRLLPAAQLNEMFTVPPVCDVDTGAQATYAAGLSRFTINGVEIWGKSGDRPGFNNGMGATRDLSRRLVYSINTLHMGGDMPVRAQRLIAAAFAA
ncbi:serine hydrolase [Actinoplanes sp. N902-109]|uniref:serine hydrolase domain-containing protein n=1 Tax=Actinoplanes sp. (strain N902-109) TaxID=649831 RepID=UPI0003295F65|nr:serine hydrolase domain-containing protein [Actinoplanes sp. N902-109]AGL17355.1 Serine-type D-Ala-D-Ala carboxypeptidase [Actinoplanes sp. N902-109]